MEKSKGGAESILHFNRAFIGAFVLANGLFLPLLIIFSDDSEAVKALIIADFSMNILISFVYYAFNRRFAKDFSEILDSMDDFLKDRKIDRFPDSDRAISLENRKLGSYFKQFYIRNGLLKKDYSDLKGVFDKFIPKDIYDQIGYRWYERITLGNCLPKKLTVMFIDIVGFTGISEKISPEKAFALLNIYFDGIGEIIHEHGGYIDKFLGDGIMAIFEKEDTSDALRCAIEIRKFILRIKTPATNDRLDIGIGVNTGEVIMGTIGTKSRMDATIIGDAVNIASRLQWLTRKYERGILVSGTTIDAIIDASAFTTSFIGEEKLRGKEKTVDIHSLEGLAG